MSNTIKRQAKPAFHGSDIEQIAAYYGLSEEKIVKFGANVNPLGLSDAVRRDLAEHLDVICSYPDREYKSLRRVIADYCGVSMEHVVTGNGSTELISLLISQRRARHALVIGPTYSEYQRELSLTGGRISSYCLPEAEDFRLDLKNLETSMAPDVDFLILCNPNNPTSSALTVDELRALLTFCRERDIFVMIDETYVEFAPHVEAISAMPLAASFDNLMIIRGVSKFFSAPGLRLGYGVTSNEAFLTMLKKHQNPWSLSSIGAYAGERMLQDTEHIEASRRLILSERERLLKELQSFRYAKTYPSYANFILVRILKDGLTSYDVFEAAIRRNMMIRDCSSFGDLPGEYIRFCIMMPEDNSRLMECLAGLLAI